VLLGDQRGSLDEAIGVNKRREYGNADLTHGTVNAACGRWAGSTRASRNDEPLPTIGAEAQSALRRREANRDRTT